MTSRYGQLTYTSFASAGNPGGWQVKETCGGITAQEADLLVAGIHTGLNPVEPLPPYPTPEQVAAFPRRLSYRRFERQTSAYWHVAPAGTDSSGRPGNVFAHALIDRRAALIEPRPIELWHSPAWLTPYGSRAVLTATLNDAEPVTGDAVTAESALSFICGRGAERFPVLCVLLDAVTGAMAGGLLTVLGVESVANAAQWIGAVSFLMSPGTARQLNFSTFDRGADLRYARQAEQHLVAVPREDLPDVPPGPVVIDEAEAVLLGEPDVRPHRTTRGPVAATTWSTLARITMRERVSAARIMAGIDRVSLRLSGRTADADLHPSLPMAFAALDQSPSAEATTAALAVIAANAPPELRAQPAVVSAVDTELRRVAGNTTTDAWRAVVDSPTLVSEAAAWVYLKRAVNDQRWLEQPGLLPIPRRLTVPTSDTVRAVIPAALAAARNRGLAHLLRVADLLIASGLTNTVYTVIDREIVPALLDEARGPALLAQLEGRITPVTRLAVAGRLFSVLDRQGEGRRFPGPLLGWLADGVVAPAADDLARAQPGDPVWTAAALRGLWALTSAEHVPQDRYLALWWLRRHPHPPGLREPDFGWLPWDPAELLVAAGDGPLPVRACLSTLVGASDSAGLRVLAERVLGANADVAAVACAAVRALPAADWLSHGYIEKYYPAYVPFWDNVIGEVGVAAVHRDFAVRFLVLSALAVASGIGEATACEALIADQTSAAEAVCELESMVASGAVSADRLERGASPEVGMTSAAGYLLSVATARMATNQPRRPGGENAWPHRIR